MSAFIKLKQLNWLADLFLLIILLFLPCQYYRVERFILLLCFKSTSIKFAVDFEIRGSTYFYYVFFYIFKPFGIFLRLSVLFVLR
jgi:hypothetical protein